MSKEYTFWEIHSSNILNVHSKNCHIVVTSYLEKEERWGKNNIGHFKNSLNIRNKNLALLGGKKKTMRLAITEPSHFFL